MSIADTLRRMFALNWRNLPYAQYLQTPHWRMVRAQAIKRAGGRCQFCNADGPLEVHHRTYERLGYERTGDVVALCPACHGALHRRLAKRANRTNG